MHDSGGELLRVVTRGIEAFWYSISAPPTVSFYVLSLDRHASRAAPNTVRIDAHRLIRLTKMSSGNEIATLAEIFKYTEEKELLEISKV